MTGPKHHQDAYRAACGRLGNVRARLNHFPTDHRLLAEEQREFAECRRLARLAGVTVNDGYGGPA